MAFDREDTLKKAEKLLRQGRLDGAIAEYVRVVEDQPRDWNSANALGDLYARAGQNDKAAAQYARIADHLMREGFYPKAGALYKKLLKLTPDDEPSQLQLAEISARQGLLADAKSYLHAVAARRRARGDRAGASEIVVRLGSLDPADIDARSLAARALAEMGDEEGAAKRYREIHSDLVEKRRDSEALGALREAVRLNPQDREGRGILAKAALAAGDLDQAREHLDRDVAADDPELLTALVEIELRSGRLDRAREILPQLLAAGPDGRHRVAEIGLGLADRDSDAGFVCVDSAVDALSMSREFDDAGALLQEFITRAPSHIPALLKLIEVCVDGGLETTMHEAQAELTDAYLASGNASEARVIAEDLVAREPWERTHIERFRRALVMLKIPDPETYIADRLSGYAPFTATDPFIDSPADTASASGAPADPEPEASTERGVAAIASPPDGVVASAAASSSPASSSPPPDSPEIDLTGELGELHRSESSALSGPAAEKGRRAGDLESVFRELREEATQSGPDHSAQHMTLARTYLEIGMENEALDSLKIAVRSPRQRFEAAALLGRFYMKRGELSEAAGWLERAAEAPAPTVEEGHALMYDFGVALETQGETARALAIFLELQADAGDYRDVAARVDRLARVQTGG